MVDAVVEAVTAAMSAPCRRHGGSVSCRFAPIPGIFFTVRARQQMLVQKLRLQRGWSQEQLAELSGLSVRTIQRIERGSTASVESLKALGAVFEVDFSSLQEVDMSAAESPKVTPQEALALAHVRRVKGFYLHLLQYAVTIAVLAIANIWLYPRYLWVGWIALGWGLGVLFHGLKAFDAIPFLNGAWERREVERRLGRKL
jgi:transcriptional regulator with XRE-family HTH domain